MSDFDHELETARNLKKAGLSAVPDDKLVWTVMCWMLNRGKNGDCLFELTAELPKPCQVVFCCQIVDGEINNGGIHQLFCNNGAEWAKMSVEGFEVLGSPNLGKVMSEALELYRQHDMAKAVEIAQREDRAEFAGKIIPYGHGYDDPAVKRFFELHKEGVFKKLDDAYYQECESVDYVKYIRQNADCFGY